MGIIMALSLYFALVRCSEKVMDPPTSAVEQTTKPLLRSASIKYYVAKTGSDGNPGTFTAPWLTISYALTKIYGGDTLF